MPFSYASVVETLPLSSRLQRIVLHVDEPSILDTAHAGDSTVGVYFGTDGCVHPESGCRSYSIRRRDGAHITIDVMLHTHGPGTRWASTAAPGDRVGLDHARSWYRPSAGTEWQLLVSDLSGMPAAARILEELPEDTVAILLIEIAADEDLGYLPQRSGVTVIPRVGTGNGYAPSTLASSVQNLDLPTGRGYCWFAGEAAESRAVRKYVRSLGWTIDQYDITGYWRRDSEAWDVRFARAQHEILPIYQRALAEGKGDKLAFEEFDEACERIGL
ncbi:siderophore-interacting protein [Mycolicibacterium austroafricanum]|uniref:siderophore-interacting protein n=1 Tax=Mycolicibacterium austroafricanum TaxID=39687 RepID=UPI000CF9CF57|nr:siderophore-interacting protein [Mycolicibacterium austroafricanum]PQP42199.1 siderophore-interacting protein [Mycolicibacterium austroafricanum]